MARVADVPLPHDFIKCSEWLLDLQASSTPPGFSTPPLACRASKSKPPSPDVSTVLAAVQLSLAAKYRESILA